MKTIHNEYNNLYYWSNDFLHEQPIQIELKENFNELIDPEQWLEENFWKYYDWHCIFPTIVLYYWLDYYILAYDTVLSIR
jgi:hypothetical protein